MSKKVVEVCLGTSCHLLGASDLLEWLQNGLPQPFKERLDIRGVACLKHCHQGPCLRLDGRLITGASPENLLQELTRVLIAGGQHETNHI